MGGEVESRGKRVDEERGERRERERKKVRGAQWCQPEIRWAQTSHTLTSLVLLLGGNTGVVSLTAVDTANSLL